MFDTTVCLVGNVMTAPEWRRTTVTGTYVATFRFASTSRRFDKENGRWVDGDSLRVKVACWRTIGQNVMQSVNVGDPLVIYGRLYSRDWLDAEQQRRTSYELDAIAIGHDLARGIGTFERNRRVLTDTINDAQGDAAIGGESSEAVGEPDPAAPHSEPGDPAQTSGDPSDGVDPDEVVDGELGDDDPGDSDGGDIDDLADETVLAAVG